MVMVYNNSYRVLVSNKLNLDLIYCLHIDIMCFDGCYKVLKQNCACACNGACFTPFLTYKVFKLQMRHMVRRPCFTPFLTYKVLKPQTCFEIITEPLHIGICASLV